MSTVSALPRPDVAQRVVRVSAYLSIARFDHWVKNVFVFPGVILALTVYRPPLQETILHVVIGMLAVGFVASSNYVINEIMDAPFDSFHPVKRLRPVPAGRIYIPLAYTEWLLLVILGLWLAHFVSVALVWVLLLLWIMGLIYNVPPVRSKDVAYLDVLSESVNNPIRMLAGWYIIRPLASPPLSLLISYWMIGCFFMATKRYAEYRDLADPARSAAYRRSFAFYNEERLLASIMFYASFAMLMLGAFIMRYRLEWILAFPLVALVMAIYLSLSFKPNSAVQRPEGLYREPALMIAVIASATALTTLLFISVPLLERIFGPVPFGLAVR
jgi:decaprenyl-phosphate phosphoribosyltransferase